jgi:hypothetical protein
VNLRLRIVCKVTAVIWCLLLLRPPWQYVSVPGSGWAQEPPTQLCNLPFFCPPVCKGPYDTVVDYGCLAEQFAIAALIVFLVFNIRRPAAKQPVEPSP